MKGEKEASYSEKLEGNRVRCRLCPHHCLLSDGKSGICLTRANSGGTLVSLNYCRPVSASVDPIEKKPLYHFYPGADIYSSGPNGCTLKCTFCQNCDISQRLLPTRYLPAHELAQQVLDSGTIGIAYTYSEPYIWFETIVEVGAKAREAGLKNVMVTNGYMEPEPLEELLSVVDAMNIDVKSMNPRFYRTLCKAELQPVLRTCERVKKSAHLEITNLLIPGENDSDDDLRALAEYIAANLGRDTPLHLSRYFPRHRMTAPPTSEAALLRAWRLAREALDYVYLGNISIAGKSDTRCPACDAALITRSGYRTKVSADLTRKGAEGKPSCASCGHTINIVTQ